MRVFFFWLQGFFPFQKKRWKFSDTHPETQERNLNTHALRREIVSFQKAELTKGFVKTEPACPFVPAEFDGGIGPADIESRPGGLPCKPDQSGSPCGIGG
jgi:hypothetical protein